MPRRLLALILPVLLGISMVLGSPPAVAAAKISGLTETGTVTYELRPAKSLIHVTVVLSIKNTKKSVSSSCRGGLYICTTKYYAKETGVGLEAAATNLTMTSNAGKVTQSVRDTTKHYRSYLIAYPPVYYGQTRVITINYDLPAAPRSKDFFRAGAAYANLCVIAQGYDGGTVKVIVPPGFDLDFYDGTSLGTSGVGTDGRKILGSGPISDPASFWSCFEGFDQSSYSVQQLTAGDHKFQIKAWPEDSSWAGKVRDDVSSDIVQLEQLVGLPMPDGTIAIEEAGSFALGDYDGTYNETTHTATVSEDVDPATVAHELSHIWFNKTLLADRWMAEGLAGYAEKVAGEGNYKACSDPGSFPGGGTPDLVTWKLLNRNSSSQDEDISSWQYKASCYLFATILGDAGDSRLKDVLKAASKGESGYAQGDASLPAMSTTPPVQAKYLLDLIDERAMVPAGVTDLGKAQDLFTKYGILLASDLTGRTDARTAYHKLDAALGGWKMPLAIRKPMASWDFGAAESAMNTANDIVELRKQLGGLDPAIKLDGTSVQTQFESAAAQSDLDAIVAFLHKELDAAAKVADAGKAYDASRSIVQSVGLMGTDVKTPLDDARSALVSLRPDDAVSAANTLTDRLAKAGDVGTQRVATVGGTAIAVLLLLLLIVAFLVRRRRSRRTALALAAAGGVAPAPGWGTDAGAWSTQPPPAPTAWPPQPAAWPNQPDGWSGQQPAPWPPQPAPAPQPAAWPDQPPAAAWPGQPAVEAAPPAAPAPPTAPPADAPPVEPSAPADRA